MQERAADTLDRWLSAINAHDVDALVALMSPDHLFIDSLGNRISGMVTMEAGWRGYFAMCPDYWIVKQLALGAGDTLLLSGEAGGTINSRLWRTPAAWRVLARDGRVLEWQVFADNRPVYEILERRD
jgi:ketosteroid isomerase-like protein